MKTKPLRSKFQSHSNPDNYMENLCNFMLTRKCSFTRNAFLIRCFVPSYSPTQSNKMAYHYNRESINRAIAITCTVKPLLRDRFVLLTMQNLGFTNHIYFTNHFYFTNHVYFTYDEGHLSFRTAFRGGLFGEVSLQLFLQGRRSWIILGMGSANERHYNNVSGLPSVELWITLPVDHFLN